MKKRISKTILWMWAIVLILSLSGLAHSNLASLDVEYGVVQDMDKGLGRLTILTPEGETITVPATLTALRPVQIGDPVRLELQEGKVKKVEQGMRS